MARQRPQQSPFFLTFSTLLLLASPILAQDFRTLTAPPSTATFDPKFIGSSEVRENQVTSLFCPSDLNFHASDGLAACCSAGDTECDIPATCSACSASSSCVTGTVVATAPTSQETYFSYACGTGGAWLATRSLIIRDEENPRATSSSDDSSSSSNQGGITGPGIGVGIGIGVGSCLIVAGVLWVTLMMRKREKIDRVPQPGESPYMDVRDEERGMPPMRGSMRFSTNGGSLVPPSPIARREARMSRISFMSRGGRTNSRIMSWWLVGQ